MSKKLKKMGISIIFTTKEGEDKKKKERQARKACRKAIKEGRGKKNDIFFAGLKVFSSEFWFF